MTAKQEKAEGVDEFVKRIREAGATVTSDTKGNAVESRPDGFRKRRRRTKSDMKQLIKDGIVADPAVGVPERVPGENEAVVDVPLARVTAEKE